MQAQRTHGPYELIGPMTDGTDRLVIRRRDGDRRKRTVAFVETVAQWDRFVAALESGAGEVAAVHIIDAEETP